METHQVDKVVCGQCGDEWLTNDEYLAHTCPKTGFTPTQPEHFGADFAAVQEAALARGAARVGEEQHPAEVAQQQADALPQPAEQPAQQ